MSDYTDEIEVEREERDGPYKYEFVLYVNGEEVMTASKLEDRGFNGPEDGGMNWTSQLRVYAHGYLDRELRDRHPDEDY